MLAGTHLSGKVFGFGDRAFIFAVRLTHQMVMTLTGKVGFRPVTMPGVNQFAVPPYQAEVTSYFRDAPVIGNPAESRSGDRPSLIGAQERTAQERTEPLKSSSASTPRVPGRMPGRPVSRVRQQHRDHGRVRSPRTQHDGFDCATRG